MKINQTWDVINRVLTNINIFLFIILLAGGDPKKVRKIPLAANILLLMVLVFLVFSTLRSWGNNTQETIKATASIVFSIDSTCTTSLA